MNPAAATLILFAALSQTKGGGLAEVPSWAEVPGGLCPKVTGAMFTERCAPDFQKSCAKDNRRNAEEYFRHHRLRKLFGLPEVHYVWQQELWFDSRKDCMDFAQHPQSVY